jgi:hypothetical protein
MVWASQCSGYPNRYASPVYKDGKALACPARRGPATSPCARRRSFARKITADYRIEDALTAPGIIPKVFGSPYPHHFKFQMSTENGAERHFVQVVKKRSPSILSEFPYLKDR